MKKRFQTKTELLLDILLEDALEDLELSDQRLAYFIEHDDMETHDLELTTNKEMKDRVEILHGLLEKENYSNSTAEYVVHIGYFNSDGEEVNIGTYIAGDK